MLYALAGLCVVFLGLLWRLGDAALSGLRQHNGHLSDIRIAFEMLAEEGAGTVRTRIGDLEDLVDRLPTRWEEIKAESARLDARARYAVGRVRKELEERDLQHDGIESLAGELRLVDGDGSESDGMLAVRADVEEVPGPDSSDQPTPVGWEEAARMKKFGF